MAASSWGQSPLLAETKLARQLQQPVTLAWEGLALGSALARLEEVQGIPLWVDRRIDPNATVKLTANNQTVRQVLDGLAAVERRDWGWTSLRTVVYFGPRQSARELATLAEIARAAVGKAPAETRRQWLAATPWEYPRLSEPRALLEATLAANGATLRDGATVPHDLWPARSLPAVAPIDRVALLLAGFDLTFEASADGRQWRLVPTEEPVHMTRDYPLNEQVQAALAAIVVADATVQVRRQGRRAAVSGRWEDHEQLRLAIRGETTEPPSQETLPSGAAGDQRFTLSITNKPVGAVLDQLAAQLGLTIAWDPSLAAATPPVRETLVSCAVREADLDALLKAILTPARLAYDRDGQTVTIRAAE